MKKFIALIAIITLVATSVFAADPAKIHDATGAESTHLLNLLGSVDDVHDTTIAVAASTSAITITAAEKADNTDFSVTSDKTIVANGSATISNLDPTTADTIYFAVYNNKYTNLAPGCDYIQDVAVSAKVKNSWTKLFDTSAGASYVTSPKAGTQMNTIKLYANDGTEVSVMQGTISFPMGRQFAGEQKFSFTAKWDDNKNLEAGNYKAEIEFTYTSK